MDNRVNCNVYSFHLLLEISQTLVRAQESSSWVLQLVLFYLKLTEWFKSGNIWCRYPTLNVPVWSVIFLDSFSKRQTTKTKLWAALHTVSSLARLHAKYFNQHSAGYIPTWNAIDVTLKDIFKQWSTRFKVKQARPYRVNFAFRKFVTVMIEHQWEKFTPKILKKIFPLLSNSFLGCKLTCYVYKHVLSSAFRDYSF